MAAYEYILASDITDDELVDGLVDGTLKEWRVDADGRQWLKRKRLPEILGVPPRLEFTGDLDEDEFDTADDE